MGAVMYQKRTMSLTVVLLFFFLLFNACDLLNDSPTEEDIKNGIPTGAWAEVSAIPTTIIEFNAPILTVHEYNSTDSIIKKEVLSFSVNDAQTQLIVTDSLEIKEISYTLAGDTIRITNSDNKTIVLAKYSGEIPPASWVEKVDEVLLDGAPEGMWINSSTDIIISFSSDTIMRYEYNAMDSIVQTFSNNFSMSSDGKAILFQDNDEIDTIPFTLVNNSLTISLDSSTMAFTTYTGTVPHSSWVLGTELLTPTGTWIEAGTTPSEILVFGTNILTIYDYSIMDSIIRKESIEYHFTKKGLIVPSDNPTVGEDTIPFTFDGTNFVVTDGSKTITFIKYDGVIPHSSWVEAIIDVDTGGVVNGLPTGAWQTTDMPMNEIIILDSDTIIIYNYQPLDSTLYYQHMPYSFNADKSSFIIVDETGVTQEVPFSFTGDTLVIITPEDDAKDTITFTPYKMEGLPEAWIINDKEIDTGNGEYNMVEGQWLNSEKDFVLQIFGDTLITVEYHAMDSMVYKHMQHYYLNPTMDTIFMTENGEMKGHASYYFNNDTLIMNHSDGGLEMFTYYDGMVPLDHWVVKDDNFEQTPLTGDWLITDVMPNELLMINNYSIEVHTWDPVDSMFEKFVFDYNTNDNLDTLWIESPTEGTMIIQIIISGDTLTFTESDGTKTVYARHKGGFPEHWKGKDTNNNGVDIIGQWLVDSPEKNEVWQFYPDSASQFMYHPLDSFMSHEPFGLRISDNKDSLYLNGKDGEMAYMIKINADTLSLYQGTYKMVLLRDHSKLPLDHWIMKEFHEDPKPAPHFGEWISSDGNRIITFGPHFYSSFDYDNGNLQYTELAYMPMMNSDTIETKTETGMKGFLILNVDADGAMLKIEDNMGVVTAFTQYMGMIPSDNWSITSGDDINFAYQDYIGTWMNGDSTEIVIINPTLITSYNYHSMDSSLSIHYMDYDLDPSGNAVIIHDMEGDMTVPMSVMDGVLTVTPEQDKGPQEFYTYTGKIPHDTWMLK